MTILLTGLPNTKGGSGGFIFNGEEGDVLKVDAQGNLVPSGVKSTKDGSLTVGSGSIDIGHHTVSSAGEGVEATNHSSNESYSFVFAGQGDDTGPVHRIISSTTEYVTSTTDTTTILTNPSSTLVSTSQVRLMKEPMTILANSARTNVKMSIESLDGEDIWTYALFDIEIGVNELVVDTLLDFRVGSYVVSFSSEDGDVELLGGLYPTTGEDVLYIEIPLRTWQDETLANIKLDGEVIREIAVSGDLTASSDSNGVIFIAEHNLNRKIVLATLDETDGSVSEVYVQNTDADGTLSVNTAKVVSSVPMLGQLTLI